MVTPPTVKETPSAPSQRQIRDSAHPLSGPKMVETEMLTKMVAAARTPAVTVGTFGSIAAPNTTPRPAREIQAVTAFAPRSVTATNQPGSDRRADLVGLAGFDRSAGSASPRPRVGAGGVADVGFTSAPSAPRAQSASKTVVNDVGFDTAPPASSPSPTPAPPVRIDTPVEILSKPTPAYTSEARALKLEGEVVLEVVFSTITEVRVVRVVRGLGHGLDEEAIRAAERIRFKPAQSGGRTVDFHTILHIVFRLT